MMKLIRIKQHLGNIWSSIHEKASNTETDLKRAAYEKKRV